MNNLFGLNDIKGSFSISWVLHINSAWYEERKYLGLLFLLPHLADPIVCWGSWVPGAIFSDVCVSYFYNQLYLITIPWTTSNRQVPKIYIYMDLLLFNQDFFFTEVAFAIRKKIMLLAQNQQKTDSVPWMQHSILTVILFSYFRVFGWCESNVYMATL